MSKLMLKINIYLFLCITSFSCTADTIISDSYQDGITLTITSAPFDEKKHTIKKCKYAVCAIDGKIFYGGSGSTPKDEVVSLVFEQKAKKVTLNVLAMYEANITQENMKERIKVQSWLGSNSYRIIGYFGTRESMYIGHWLVLEDSSIRNHLSDYESLVSLVFEVKKDHNIPQ